MCPVVARWIKGRNTVGRASSDRISKSVLAILQRKKIRFIHTRQYASVFSRDITIVVKKKKEKTCHIGMSIGSLARYVKLCSTLKVKY